MNGATILWRRLDTEGHDCCRLSPAAGVWRVDGVASFLHESLPACLRYEFWCDAAWRATEATVSGWAGGEAIELRFDRSDAGVWRMNGTEQPLAGNPVDLDLGFTPATNILPIRRLALAVGEEIAAPGAYLAFPELRLDLLEQSYRRLDGARYAYAAPRFGYEGILAVSDAGFVTSYPGLWQATGEFPR